MASRVRRRQSGHNFSTWSAPAGPTRTYIAASFPAARSAASWITGTTTTTTTAITTTESSRREWRGPLTDDRERLPPRLANRVCRIAVHRNRRQQVRSDGENVLVGQYELL